MGFFEEVAEALDNEGIESRFNDGTLFVPIAPELEIQFEEISANIPAANVFLARSEGLEEEDLEPEFEAVLVGVVFSVEAAVEQVARHIATDEIVDVLETLLGSSDDRLADLEFNQDEDNPLLVTAMVAEESLIAVEILPDAAQLSAQVRFVSFFDNDLGSELGSNLGSENDEVVEEILELGTFHDVEDLLNALEVAAAQSEYWEQLVEPLDGP